jgi:serine/threonine-protein kinase
LPFFSPGGQWIGYYAKGKLMRVSISGGKPIPIRPITLPHGVAWGPDETIIFQADGLLQRVPVTGGKPEPIESNDPQKDKVAWVHQLLPGGKHLLASIGASFGILDLSAKQWKVLGKGARAQYIDPGYVLFHAPAVGQGELQVASLNLETMQLGPPGHAWSDVFRATNNGPAFFAASFNGTVVFAREGLNRTLVQVDRNGRRTPLIAERAGYRLPRFSSDRRYLAVTVDPRPPKFRVFDLERGSNVTLSKEGGYGFGAAWNGNQVAYTDDDGIYVGPADGSLPPEKWGGNNSWFPRFWISNRELLAYTVPGRIGIIRRGELPQVLFEGGRRPGISADRHWIAYDVAEGDREEVYVRSFPDLKQTIRMTYDGCHSPMFSPSPDGREVFCMDGNALFTVPYQVQNGKFSPDKRKFLFDGPFETSNFLGYDTTDGKTFVMVLADPEANPDRLEIVQNWSPEAKRGN